MLSRSIREGTWEISSHEGERKNPLFLLPAGPRSRGEAKLPPPGLGEKKGKKCFFLTPVRGRDGKKKKKKRK